jgi:hypothetical protein
VCSACSTWWMFVTAFLVEERGWEELVEEVDLSYTSDLLTYRIVYCDSWIG